ncbi:hypothetical protein ACO9S2_17005 [Nitrospira sp. NS4]|uniref:hypothetical protein n=1 Tax=Nitrospira sp. NS4 TaxID=3414498 RepID=UPI003C2F77CC
MAKPQLEHLLGGFAADQLTPDEKQRLYSAALHDQELFNALADEQALKELLADPAARRRLLQALNQTSPSGAGGSLSWTGWFRRPPNLALAGGLVTAVFAIVLGTKMYQDSLKQAAQSIAHEESAPAAPPAPAPSGSQPVEPAVTPAKKDGPSDKLAKPAPPAPPLSKESRASDAGRQNLTTPNEQDRAPSQAEAPMTMRGKAAEEVAPVTGQQIAQAPHAPAASMPVPMQAPAKAPVAGAAAPTISARALFYGGLAARVAAEALPPEREQAAKTMDESPPQANRLERKREGMSPLGNVAGASATTTPLGLRCSFVVRGSDGQDREADAATAAGTEPVRLTVQTNQNAYLQVWMMSGPSTTQLLFPAKGSGQISARVAAGQRQSIPLPAEHNAAALIVRVSLVPFGPVSRQEAALLDRPGAGQLREVVATPSPTGQAEHATYVVTADPSTPIQAVLELAPRR